jgi:anion-transporting  ArsA/GET3 family ATPase
MSQGNISLSDSTDPALSLSTARDSKTLAKKAIAMIPPELNALANDPK